MDWRMWWCSRLSLAPSYRSTSSLQASNPLSRSTFLIRSKGGPCSNIVRAWNMFHVFGGIFVGRALRDCFVDICFQRIDLVRHTLTDRVEVHSCLKRPVAPFSLNTRGLPRRRASTSIAERIEPAACTPHQFRPIRLLSRSTVTLSVTSGTPGWVYHVANTTQSRKTSQDDDCLTLWLETQGACASTRCVQ